MTTKPMIKAVLLLIICTFFWGSGYPISKDALHEMNALSLVFWRFLIASSCLAIYLLVSRISLPRLPTSRWLLVIAISALGVGGFNLIVFTGLSYTNATNGALIMALSPLTTSLIGCVMLRSRPSITQCCSLLVSFVGVLLVITNGHFETLFSMEINYGDQLIFCGMLAWSAYTYFSQGISRWMPVIPYTCVGMLSGTLLVGLVCLLTPSIHPVSELLTSQAKYLVEILYIAIFGTVAGYLLWLDGVNHLGSAKASVFFNLVPIYAMLTSSLLGQAVTELQIIGIVVVILGLLLPRIVSFKRTHALEDISQQ
ncbi:membrane protein [Shewanella mangrovi]|uniref:Membrane protein n=2 Tax=Shewanella mangrovi TaxID=1515746 RepID=A0A094J9A9_9GAMM|nr:membrane protein [Shewanella mangrovi]